MRVGLRCFLLIVTLGSLIAASLAIRSRSTTMQSSLDDALQAHRLRQQAGPAGIPLAEMEEWWESRLPPIISPEWAAGCELRVMPDVKLSRFPREGRRLVVVGNQDKLLRIWIFDDEGRKVVDIAESDTRFVPAHDRRVLALLDRLPQLAPPHQITDQERNEVAVEAAVIVNLTRQLLLDSREIARAEWKAKRDRLIAEAERLEALSRP